ncbi:MAG: NB-ARC domain-containing protein, partial [Rhodospirillales bacterium]|nr:NB-ARC domain-containing protein [Rhodospirillales bacterium]
YLVKLFSANSRTDEELRISGVALTLNPQGCPIEVPPLLREHEVEAAVVPANDVLPQDPVPSPGRPYAFHGPVLDFLGRESTIDRLAHLVRDEGKRVLVFHGHGGVGKTELAMAVAQRLSGLYSGPRVKVDLRGTWFRDSAPLTPLEAQEAIVNMLNPDPSGKPATYAQMLKEVADRGERLVLLLDDAGDAGQVEDLVRDLPPHCLALITSRTRFTLPDNEPIDVEPLKRRDSIGLLQSICKRLTDKQAKDIAELCGDLPLALRLAGQTLAARDDLAADDYIRDLGGALRIERLDRDETSSRKRIQVTIDQSYRVLEAAGGNLATIWLQLAVLRGGFDVAAAAAVCDESNTRSVQDALSDLYRFSMLGWDPHTRRYRLHDLFRDYALEKIAPGIEQAARHRHARFFHDVLEAAERTYRDQDQVGALATFDTERHHIEDAFQWSAERIEQDAEAATLCEAFPRIGVELLHLRQPLEQRIAWRRAALDA